MKREIDTVVNMLRAERPVELSLFVSWFRYIFSEEEDVVEEVSAIEEVKTMLSTSLKKYGKEIEKEALQKGIQKGMQKGIAKGMEEGARRKSVETAAALVKEKMSVQKIADITGLTADEVNKIKSES